MSTLAQLGETDQSTKDNIGTRDSNKDQILLRNRESVFIEEGPTQIQQQLIGTAFILGHSANGVLGTSTLGAGTLGSYTKYSVVNPDKTFHEHFRDTDFRDSVNTTGTWDTTNFRVELMITDQMQTGSIFYDYKEVSGVKITASTSGLKIRTQIDEQNFSGGREVNLT